MEKGTCIIKNLNTGRQEETGLANLTNYLFI
jgi:hypothetical protein